MAGAAEPARVVNRYKWRRLLRAVRPDVHPEVVDLLFCVADADGSETRIELTEVDILADGRAALGSADEDGGSSLGGDDEAGALAIA